MGEKERVPKIGDKVLAQVGRGYVYRESEVIALAYKEGEVGRAKLRYFQGPFFGARTDWVWPQDLYYLEPTD